MGSSVGGDCVVSDKRDIKVFMVGIIGDIGEEFVFSRRIMDWMVWILVVLEGLEEPHSTVPQVHVGFKIVL